VIPNGVSAKPQGKKSFVVFHIRHVNNVPLPHDGVNANAFAKQGKRI
jgi:hypothetical protein